MSNKLLLIVGTAACVWNDLDRFLAFGVPHDVMVVNDMGFHFPGVYQHWFSCHCEYLQAKNFRRWRGEHEFQTHSTTHAAWVDRKWDFGPFFGGDSVDNACRAAFEMGYERVVLAGAPKDESPHYYSKPGAIRQTSTAHDANFLEFGGNDREWWKKAERERWKGRVKAMSGMPAEVCGEPDKEWLCQP